MIKYAVIRPFNSDVPKVVEVNVVKETPKLFVVDQASEATGFGTRLAKVAHIVTGCWADTPLLAWEKFINRARVQVLSMQREASVRSATLDYALDQYLKLKAVS